MERRVVITGMGIWSCLGTTLDEVRQSLYSGKSGIIFSQERVDAGFRSPFCANVPIADLKPFVNRNFRQFMPEEAQYAMDIVLKQCEEWSDDDDYTAEYAIATSPILTDVRDDDDMVSHIETLLSMTTGTSILNIVQSCQERFNEKYPAMIGKQKEWYHVVSEYVKSRTRMYDLQPTQIFHLAAENRDS